MPFNMSNSLAVENCKGVVFCLSDPKEPRGQGSQVGLVGQGQETGITPEMRVSRGTPAVAVVTPPANPGNLRENGQTILGLV